jgi:hypothetical protein
MRHHHLIKMYSTCFNVNAYLALHSNPWRYTAIIGVTQQSLALHSNPWRYTAIIGVTQQSLALHSNPWRYTAILGVTQQSLTLHSNPWRYTAFPFTPVVHQQSFLFCTFDYS